MNGFTIELTFAMTETAEDKCILLALRALHQISESARVGAQAA
jgi:hypothetical protein